MSGFQFVHVETYGRKADAKGRSVSYVLDEAERRPEASTHVSDSRPPVVVYGCSVGELRALHDDQAGAAMCTTKAGKARRVRQDQHTLLTVVASHPASPGDDPEAVAAWQARTVEWLHATWGDGLRSVIRHDDERHVHVHVYVLPGDPEMRARALHPGAAAKSEAKTGAVGLDAKAANKLGDAAYVAAMRGLQDSYFHQVGIQSGLARLGPGRRRLTREGWQAEKAAATAAADAITRSRAVCSEAMEVAGKAVRIQHAAQAKSAELAAGAHAFVAKAKADGQAALAEADRVKAQAAAELSAARREAASVLRQAKAEAHQVMAASRVVAVRLRTWGERLGGVWTGLAGVQRRLERQADRRVQRAEERAVGLVERARVDIHAELEKRFGVELAGARRQAQEGESAVVALTDLRRDVNKLRGELAREKAGHGETRREREVFRSRWADADNAVHVGGHGRRRR